MNNFLFLAHTQCLHVKFFHCYPLKSTWFKFTRISVLRFGSLVDHRNQTCLLCILKGNMPFYYLLWSTQLKRHILTQKKVPLLLKSRATSIVRAERKRLKHYLYCFSTSRIKTRTLDHPRRCSKRPRLGKTQIIGTFGFRFKI